MASSFTTAASATAAPPQQSRHVWMELACFDTFPAVPSVTGTLVQSSPSLLGTAAAHGATAPPPSPAAVVELVFELFDGVCPTTCRNFRALCAAGDDVEGNVTRHVEATLRPNQFFSTTAAGPTVAAQQYWYRDVVPSYRGTVFHKIIPGFVAQGGDLTMRADPAFSSHVPPYNRSHGGNANRYTGLSRRRGWFTDESKKKRFNEPGLLCMANNGPNSNGSKFFITLDAGQYEQALRGRYVCFGRVVRGLQAFMDHVGRYGDTQGHPRRYVVVSACGVGDEVPADSFAHTLASSAVAAADTTVASHSDSAVAGADATYRTSPGTQRSHGEPAEFQSTQAVQRVLLGTSDGTRRSGRARLVCL